MQQAVCQLPLTQFARSETFMYTSAPMCTHLHRQVRAVDNACQIAPQIRCDKDRLFGKCVPNGQLPSVVFSSTPSLSVRFGAAADEGCSGNQVIQNVVSGVSRRDQRHVEHAAVHRCCRYAWSAAIKAYRLLRQTLEAIDRQVRCTTANTHTTTAATALPVIYRNALQLRCLGRQRLMSGTAAAVK